MSLNKSLIVVDGKPYRLGKFTTVGEPKEAANVPEDHVVVYKKPDGTVRAIPDPQMITPYVRPYHEVVFKPVVDVEAFEQRCPECDEVIETSSPEGSVEPLCSECGLLLDHEEGERRRPVRTRRTLRRRMARSLASCSDSYWPPCFVLSPDTGERWKISEYC